MIGNQQLSEVLDYCQNWGRKSLRQKTCEALGRSFDQLDDPTHLLLIGHVASLEGRGEALQSPLEDLQPLLLLDCLVASKQAENRV